MKSLVWACIAIGFHVLSQRVVPPSGLSPPPKPRCMIEGGARLLEPAQAANAGLKLLVKTLNAVIHTELIFILVLDKSGAQ